MHFTHGWQSRSLPLLASRTNHISWSQYVEIY
jgi:hypothetical protein